MLGGNTVNGWYSEGTQHKWLNILREHSINGENTA